LLRMLKEGPKGLERNTLEDSLKDKKDESERP
jgi:hypothetical protein